MMKMKFLLLLPVLLCVQLMIKAQSLKMMTYNIRLDVSSDGENDWTHRKEFLTSQIKFYEPDVFGVQEALPNQVADISTYLPGYTYVGTGRDGIGKGEYSAVFYKKGRFAVKNEGTFWLSETPGTISKGWDAALNRICTYVLLEDEQTKNTIWVFNAHLDHIGEMARTRSIELILSKISEYNTKKFPVVFMGDFNSEPQTERIKDLKKVMTDCRDISVEKPFGPPGTFNGFKFNEPVTRLIDYIFISQPLVVTVKKFAVLSDSKDLRYPSDHLPVYVELEFNNH